MLTFIISCGVIAWVYRNVLLKQGMILGWLADWMDTNSERYHWIIYPMGYCSKCFAGQLSLWAWLYVMPSWDWFQHLTVICGAIFVTVVLDKVLSE